MADNVKKNHTTDLTDGNYILSPSLTNIYEGVHGNGILTLEDGATGDSGRNNPANMPGYISGTGNTLTVKGGYAVLDGLLITFANGYNSNEPASYNIVLQDSRVEGSNSALSTGETVLFVVYVCTDGTTGKENVHVEMGTAVSSGYPTTPTSFLTKPNSSLSSVQTTVLAVVKCEYSASGGDLKLNITDVMDKRTFIRPSPMYLTPMSTGSVGDTVTDTNRIDSHTDLDGIHGGSAENGALLNSEMGALWLSNSNAGDNVLYFSGKQDSARRTYRLGPNKLSTSNVSQTFRFDGVNFFHATPTSNITLTASGTFPPSHTITVNNAAASTYSITFGSFTVGAQSAAIFAYDGSAWQKIFASSSSSSSSSGSTGYVQLSDGSSGFTSDSKLTWNSGTPTLTVDGKLTVTGLIDPTGLELSPQSSNPGATADNTLWLDSGTSNRLKQGSTKFLMEGDSGIGITTFVGLSDTPANFTGSANKFLQVNSTPDALIFDNIAEGDLPTALPSVASIGQSGSGAAGILTINKDLTVTGDLIVSGSATTVSSTIITVDDKNIELGAVDTPTDTTANGGGITLKGATDKTITWSSTNTAWTFNQHLFPNTDSSLNLGATATRFATGYFDAADVTAITAGTITGSDTVNIDSGLLYVDTTNDRVGISQTSPDATFQIKETGYGYGTDSIASGANDGNTSIDIVLFNAQKFRATKLLVEVVNTTDSKYETAEMVVTHNGTSTVTATGAFLTIYGVVTTDGVLQGNYNATINSGNVELQVTPAVSSKDVSVAVSWQAMTI